MVQGPTPKGTNPKGTKDNSLILMLRPNQKGTAFGSVPIYEKDPACRHMHDF